MAALAPQGGVKPLEEAYRRPKSPPWSCTDSTLEGIADEPQHRRPQAHEQRPALRVSALTLIVCLRPDPEADAQKYGRHRDQVQLPTSQTDAMDQIDQHDSLIAPIALPLTLRDRSDESV
jgi:hypothetical protein